MAKPRHKPLKGYERVRSPNTRAKGKTIAWVTPSGGLITDYQYKSRVARKKGWKNYSELDRFKRSQQWKRDWEWSLRTRFRGTSNTAWDSRTIRDAYIVERERARNKNETLYQPGVAADATPLGRLLIQRNVLPQDHVWGDSP